VEDNQKIKDGFILIIIKILKEIIIIIRERLLMRLLINKLAKYKYIYNLDMELSE
jgi:hypothetical protein